MSSNNQEDQAKSAQKNGLELPQLLFKSSLAASPAPNVSKPTVSGSFVNHDFASSNTPISLSGVNYSNSGSGNTGGDLLDLGNDDSDDDDSTSGSDGENDDNDDDMNKERQQTEKNAERIVISENNKETGSKKDVDNSGKLENVELINKNLAEKMASIDISNNDSITDQKKPDSASHQYKSVEIDHKLEKERIPVDQNNNTRLESEGSDNKEPVASIETEKELHKDIESKKDSSSETPLIRAPLITTESKDRIINRVPMPVKSKQQLKEQEKKLQETKIKNEQDRSRQKKQDPNNLPFDFQRFLTYLKSKSADSIVKYLKSFLIAFSKKNWTVAEQVKLITDFKNFIYDKMTTVQPFSKMNETEFINCQEGMEKLIMNRLYDQVFSPVIMESKLDKSHKEDISKDEFLKNQILRFSWVTNEHLDLDNYFVTKGESFIQLAISELIKINNYRSPRDKIICILNCCKVIFAMLKNSAKETNADAFIPTLIYIVLRTDEDLRLNSNISYIERFRNEDGLAGEVSYYVSSFWAVIGFVESLNKDSLTITQDEWDSYMKPFEETNKSELEDLNLQKELEQRKLQNKKKIASKNAQTIPDTGTEQEDNTNSSNLSPGPLPISQILSPLQSIQSFFQGIGDDSTSSGSNANMSGFLDEERESTPLNSRNLLDLRLANTGSGISANEPQNPDKVANNNSVSSGTTIKQQTLTAPNLDSQVLSTPTILSWGKNKLQTLSLNQNEEQQQQGPQSSNPNQSVLEKFKKQSRAEYLAQQAFEKEADELTERLSAMFPSLDKEIIKDVVILNKARASVCVDTCLQLTESS